MRQSVEFVPVPFSKTVRMFDRAMFQHETHYVAARGDRSPTSSRYSSHSGGVPYLAAIPAARRLLYVPVTFALAAKHPES